MATSAHLPGCTVIPFRQMYEEALSEAEPGSAWAEHIQGCIDEDEGAGGILKCDDACPVLARCNDMARAFNAKLGGQ